MRGASHSRVTILMMKSRGPCRTIASMIVCTSPSSRTLVPRSVLSGESPPSSKIVWTFLWVVSRILIKVWYCSLEREVRGMTDSCIGTGANHPLNFSHASAFPVFCQKLVFGICSVFKSSLDHHCADMRECNRGFYCFPGRSLKPPDQSCIL